MDLGGISEKDVPNTSKLTKLKFKKYYPFRVELQDTEIKAHTLTRCSL